MPKHKPHKRLYHAKTLCCGDYYDPDEKVDRFRHRQNHPDCPFARKRTTGPKTKVWPSKKALDKHKREVKLRNNELRRKARKKNRAIARSALAVVGSGPVQQMSASLVTTAGPTPGAVEPDIPLHVVPEEVSTMTPTAGCPAYWLQNLKQLVTNRSAGMVTNRKVIMDEPEARHDSDSDFSDLSLPTAYVDEDPPMPRHAKLLSF